MKNKKSTFMLIALLAISMNVFAQNTEYDSITKPILINLSASEECLDGTLLFREDFDKYGDGLNPNSRRLSTEPLSDGRTDYQFISTANPPDGWYALAKYTGRESEWPGDWIVDDDNTSPNDSTIGRFMLINADYQPRVFYRHQIENLCPESELYFSAIIANCNYKECIKPNLTFSVLTLTGEKITSYDTGEIPTAIKPSSEWKRYGFRFTLPENIDAIKLEIRNNANGGSGNDFGMDDIEIRLCVPPVFINAPETVCVDSTAQLTGSFTNDGTFSEPLAYRWFKDGEEIGEDSPILTINKATKADEGYYRLAVSSSESIGSENCRAMSEPIFLAVDYCGTYIITATADKGGIISPSGMVTVNKGENQTFTFTSDECYQVNEIWVDGTVVATNISSFTFNNVTDNHTIHVIFEKVLYDVFVSADPPGGGTITGGGNYACGEVTVTIEANECYTFINWTKNDVVVSTDTSYTFTVTESITLIANLKPPVFYDVFVSANPFEGGTITGGGNYACGEITVTVESNDCYTFINWTKNGVVVSTDTSYTFTVTESATLIANFVQPMYTIIAIANDENYGHTTGSGEYEDCSAVRVEAFVNNCYRFANWTTIDGDTLSVDYIYEFQATEDITLIANFFALDFDDYALTFWGNTFMLDLAKLRREEFGLIHCIWYKNGNVEDDTRTINEFSYSAGPYSNHKLECEPTWYMFELITENYGNLCSTHKLLKDCPPSYASPSVNLVIYPNPTLANNSFTVENVIEGEIVQVYNQYGICVSSVIATDNVITLKLTVSEGIYLIRCGEKYGKLVVK